MRGWTPLTAALEAVWESEDGGMGFHPAKDAFAAGAEFIRPPLIIISGLYDPLIVVFAHDHSCLGIDLGYDVVVIVVAFSVAHASSICVE
jgi:hypothetical protein